MPHHACDPATLPHARSWGPAQVSVAPGHSLSYGTTVSGNRVFFGSPLRCFASAVLLRGAVALADPGWAGCHRTLGTAREPARSCCMAVVMLVTPSPCTGHYPACALPSKPCKLLMGHGKARWSSAGTDPGDRDEVGALLGQRRAHAGVLYRGLSWGAGLGAEQSPCCRAPRAAVWGALATEVAPFLLGKGKRRPWAQLLPGSCGS